MNEYERKQNAVHVAEGYCNKHIYKPFSRFTNVTAPSFIKRHGRAESSLLLTTFVLKLAQYIQHVLKAHAQLVGEEGDRNLRDLICRMIRTGEDVVSLMDKDLADLENQTVEKMAEELANDAKPSKWAGE